VKPLFESIIFVALIQVCDLFDSTVALVRVVDPVGAKAAAFSIKSGAKAFAQLGLWRGREHETTNALEQYVFRLNRKVQPKHIKLLAKIKPRAFI
jgi:hypothetical protein